jgi:hypothetical protein
MSAEIIPFDAVRRAEHRAAKAIRRMIEYRDFHVERVMSSLEALERTRRVLPPEYDDAGTKLMDILIEGYRRHAATHCAEREKAEART